MPAPASHTSMFAHLLGSWETVSILAVALVLFGANKLPELMRGLGEGASRFRKSLGGLSKVLDQGAHDAGESLGGIYGKPAAQALTPDNQTAELYDPAVLNNPEKTRRGRKRIRLRGWSRLWRWIHRLVSQHLVRDGDGGR